MATVVCSALSLIHLQRAFESLPKENPEPAAAAADAIHSAVDNLGAHPLPGRRVNRDKGRYHTVASFFVTHHAVENQILENLFVYRH
jgi:plasmid stabilization system protein ParE